MSSTEKEPVVKPAKKRPGRPKKVNINPDIKLEGVCANGFIENSVMELIYYNPSPLKKVVSFFKSMNVRDLTFKFYTNKAVITTTDHLNKSDIIVEIDGNKMLRYYCKKEFSITIDPENMKRVFHLVNKECEKIIFYSYEGSEFSSFNVMVDCVAELGTDSNHTINLINKGDNGNKKLPDVQKYPLLMSIPSKTWKHYVNHIYVLADEFTIQHLANKNETSLKYTAANQKISNTVVLHNMKKGITIKYNNEKNDLFMTGIRCEYCKPLSSILISEFIIIRVSESEKINFEADINGGECVINVFTEIIPIAKNFGK